MRLSAGEGACTCSLSLEHTLAREGPGRTFTKINIRSGTLLHSIGVQYSGGLSAVQLWSSSIRKGLHGNRSRVRKPSHAQTQGYLFPNQKNMFEI